MKRGEIWTVAGAGDYLSKPRPVVIIQDEHFNATDSITICAFTTDPTDAPLFRVPVQPSAANGLTDLSRIMADKVTTVRKTRLGVRVGQLGADDISRLNRALAVFLGLAGATTDTEESDSPS